MGMVHPDYHLFHMEDALAGPSRHKQTGSGVIRVIFENDQLADVVQQARNKQLLGLFHILEGGQDAGHHPARQAMPDKSLHVDGVCRNVVKGPHDADAQRQAAYFLGSDDGYGS